MTNEEAKVFLDNLKICIDEHPIVADWLVEIADRKTEPTSSKMEQVDESQIQLTARCLNCNNAKACKENHWDGCVYEPKDEKTCETCRHWKYIAHEWQCEACKCQGYEPKDESQADYDKGLQLFADILFDKEKSEQFLKECKAMGIEPQTERSE